MCRAAAYGDAAGDLIVSASITLTVPESVLTTYTSSFVGLAVTPVGLFPVAEEAVIFSVASSVR